MLIKLDTAKSIVQSIADEVDNGNLSPADAYLGMKDLQDLMTKAMEAIKTQADEEFKKLAQGQKSFVYLGRKLTYVDGRRTYDFKHIPEWVELNERIKTIEKAHKEAADAYLKNKSIVDEATGELIKPAVVKYGKPFIVFEK